MPYKTFLNRNRLVAFMFMPTHGKTKDKPVLYTWRWYLWSRKPQGPRHDIDVQVAQAIVLIYFPGDTSSFLSRSENSCPSLVRNKGNMYCTRFVYKRVIFQYFLFISSSPGEGRRTWRERRLSLREGMLNNRERVQDTKDDLLTVKEQLQETKEDVLLIKRQLQDSTEDRATQAQLHNISTALEQTRAQLQATNSALQVVTAPSE